MLGGLDLHLDGPTVVAVLHPQCLQGFPTDRAKRTEVGVVHVVEQPQGGAGDDIADPLLWAERTPLPPPARARADHHLGLTGHSGGMEACLEAAIDDGRFDVFCIRYDFVSYPDQGRILRRAAEKGIGTMVFKVNAGNRQIDIEKLTSSSQFYNQAAVKWALTNPDVASVCLRITNFDQLREYAAAVGTNLDDDEVAMLRHYAEEMYDKYCRFCGTCEASCPHEVAVADVMRFAMYFKYYGREKDAMQRYQSLPGDFTAATCDACVGSCDAACPFGRAVRAELVEAHQMLSFSRA